MQNTRRIATAMAMGFTALASTLLSIGCSSVGSPTGPSAATGGTSSGVTIQGTVQGGAGASSLSAAASTSAAGLKVSVVDTGLSATTNESGQFTLAGAPNGRIALRFEGPGVDARVELAGLMSGQTIRLEVNVAGTRATASSEAEFTGSVTSVGASSLNVSGIAVLVSSATEIKRGASSIPLSDIRVGETVSVEGALNPDGTVAARQIKALGSAPTPSASPSPTGTPSPSPSATPSPGSAIEFTGTITSIGASSLVISGRTVTVNSSTEIKRNDRDARITDLQVGDTAKVEGSLLPTGTVLAREIKANGAGTPGGTTGASVKFTGTIQSISLPSSLIVGSTRVVVDSSTEIRGDSSGSGSGRTTLSGLKAGERVEVEGVTQSDGSVLARKIKVDG